MIPRMFDVMNLAGKFLDSIFLHFFVVPIDKKDP